MKTDDLIAALVVDNGRHPIPFLQQLALAVLIGLGVAVAVYFLVLGPRADLASAATTVRFMFKVAMTLAVLATAAWLSSDVVRPTFAADLRMAVLLVAPAMLVASVLIELVVMPPSEWLSRWIGHNARWCLLSIPLLSLGPLVAVLLAMRSGAPSDRRTAGAIAGLIAAGVGSALYATHCTDDSPLFVATWYSIAISAVTLIGAFIGPRVLRW